MIVTGKIFTHDIKFVIKLFINNYLLLLLKAKHKKANKKRKL